MHAASRLAWLLVPLLTGLCLAQDSPTAPKESPKPPVQKALPGLQDNDDPVEPLIPKRPRTLAEDQRIKAAAHFAAGRILEEKSDFPAALREYKKSIELDPKAVEVYRALIELSQRQGLNDEALKWAEKAVDLDPSDYGLLLQLGVVRLGRGDIANTLKYWEKAVKVPGIKQNPNLYFTALKDLSTLYLRLGRKDDAVKMLAELFEGLEDSSKYRLDLQTRAKLLGNDPALFYEEVGELFLDSKQVDLAVRAFQKASSVSRRGGSANLNYNLARVYLQTDKADKALEELQKYFDAQRQAKGRVAFELLEEILTKLNKDDLVTRLEAMAEKDPRNSLLQFYLAEKYAKANRLDDAEQLYKKVLSFAAEAEGFRGLAAVYRRQGKPKDLLETLGRAFLETNSEIDALETEVKAIAADEKLVEGLAEAGHVALKANESSPQMAGAYVVVGSVLIEAKKPEQAIEFLKRSLDLRPTRDAYVALADVYSDDKKYIAAADVLKQAANDGTQERFRLSYLYSLSRIQELGGDTKGALDSISQALAEASENPQLRFQEAWIYYHAQQYDEAIPRLEKLINSLTKDGVGDKKLLRMSQFSLSNIFVLKGDVAKGMQLLEDVYKEDPDDISVNNDLGYLYADQGKNLEQAEKMIRKALDAEPDNAAYLDSMGWVLFKLGKHEEALPYIQKSVEKSTGGGDETLLDHLGDVYDKLNQPAKALENWKKALDSAKKEGKPDQKLIDRLEEKIRNQEKESGKLKPASPNNP